jgi:dipeptidyl aminopeptidase/acylaminoacyl peptidase
MNATTRAAFLALLLSSAASFAHAQSAPAAATPTAAARTPKKVLGIADYTRWRNIEGAQISSDGKWVAYTLRYTNVLPKDSRPVLHVMNTATKRDITVESASGAVFSPDSRFVVYTIDSIPAPRPARGAATDSAAAPKAVAAAKPPRMELRDLATGTTQAWQGMATGTFNTSSTHLLMRRRAPASGASGRAGGAPSAGARRGSDVILYDLKNRRAQFLGAVGDALFNTQGTLLAYSVEAELKDANGLFLLDLATGSTKVLDNDAKSYSRLSWSDDGKGIAVLKASDVEKMREHTANLVVFGDVSAASPKALIVDPDSTPNFPHTFVISDRAPMTWSEDNRRVFFGIIPQTALPDTSRRKSTDSVADVDVWRTADRRIQSQQMIEAESERNFTFRQAFNIDTRTFVALTDSTMTDLQLSPDGRWAVGRDERAYISDYKPATADIYRVDTSTGQRTLMLKGQLIGRHVYGIAPDGHSYLYWKDGKFDVYDLENGTIRTLGAGAPSFVDTEFDNPGTPPSFGVQGYTADGKGVIVSSDFDVWMLPLDGTSQPKNLTRGVGAKNEIQFRLVRTTPISETASRRMKTGQVYDLSKPVTLSAFGKFTKKSGFYELAGSKLREIVYDEAAFSTPQRARDAETYLFTRQTFVEFPDLRISGPAFNAATKISDANPQQSEYMWGHRMLVDFTNRDGRRLQALLTLPDDYVQGEKRPMMVNFYEKNSQNLYRYTPPAYLTGMGSSPIEAVSRGYITLIPDVYFHTGSSHSDMLDAVEAATRKVIELGYADPAHISVNGHSYGGEGAAYIGTMSKLFAAVGVGAGVSDLFTDFSQSWGWSYQVTGGSGQNGNDYYLYGQGRWGFSPWDKPEVYYSESAITHVPNVVAPILIMHGTADPTVSFSEGMNFYNALRYNNKEAYMLAYTGEGHGLRGLANRRDLTIRFFQFFDHYLKGAPAPKWMTQEVPYLRKDALRDPAGGGN